MTPRGPDFILIPWQRDFLQGLVDFALEDTRGHIDRALFIFPNSRPEKYLSRLLRSDARIRRPLVMPRMLTISALFSELRSRIQSRPAWTAGLLDRVGLLLNCARLEQATEAGKGAGHDPSFSFLQDAGRFFPWGVRLAALYEECFNQGGRAENFLHLEGEVSPFAAKLLSRLGNIYQRYVEGLDEREWTTPGRDAAIVAEHLDKGQPLPGATLATGPVYIAGFHSLTHAEKKLVRHFWQEGARILIHADPALAGQADGGGDLSGTGAHWSCSIFKEWAGEWKTDIVAAQPGEAPPSPPAIRYYQGYDLHSQLMVMQEELRDLDAGRAGNNEAAIPENALPENLDEAANTVVVLPDSGLLMPVLHHLPRTDVNISMGYPLARSPLFRLLDTIVRLQENRRGKNYYWRDLLDLIRHPYLKMLYPGPAEGAQDGAVPSGALPGSTEDTAPLRLELHRLEQVLRNNTRRYVDPLLMLEEMYQSLDAEDLPDGPVLALLERLFAVCLTGFEDRASPKDMGIALESLCNLLLDCGARLWERFLIDAECLFRIMQSLIPELSRSSLAEDAFPAPTLLGILRRLMQEERVPFEASPLVGLQVMGMLETRLLFFRRVLILDTGENSLPGSPAGDPLLPEALRPELGLPALAAREEVSAYHFFRLLAGAEHVLLLWQEGGDSPGIQEQKKKKSRFVEELLWREEKKRGRILEGNEEDSPLQRLTPAVAPVLKSRKGVRVTDSVRRRMRQTLSSPVSASLLDSYLRCPVQFYYRHLAGLEAREEVAEGDDPILVGNLFHATLQECYMPHLGRDLPGGEELHALLAEDMTAAFVSSPGYAALVRSLPADSSAMLRLAGEKRISDYLLAQPPTRILALETPLCAETEISGSRYALYGKADRIDLRLFNTSEGEGEAGIQILDYKTGRLPEIRASIWQNDGLWDRMRAWQAKPSGDEASSAAILGELAQNIQSVQLPFYLFLYALSGDKEPGAMPANAPHCNAAWIELADKGEEKYLFSAKLPQLQNWDFVRERGGILVHFILRHMLQARTLEPRPGEHCRWCFSAKLCIQGDG